MSGILLILLLALASGVLGRVFHLDAAFFPLPIIGVAAVVLLCSGYCGLLPLGLCLVIVGLFVIAVWGLVKLPPIRLRISLFSPALLLWAAASAAIWVLFSIRQPMFNQWDEFTFWGNACRIVMAQNRLYPGAPGNLPARAYMPGMMLVSYLFQFIGDYAEWKVLAAYDALFFACIAAALALPRERWARCTLLALAAVLLPWFFSAPAPGQVSYVYRSAMGDLPLGFLFGGTLALWLGVGWHRLGRWMTAAALCLLALTKDMGLAYALIIAGVVFLDGCVYPKALSLRQCGKALRAAVPLALPAPLLYLIWSRYCAATAGVNKNAVGSAGASYGQILAGGIRQLLGRGRTEEFSVLMREMAGAFRSRTVCLLGGGAAALLVILLVAAAAYLTGERGAFRRRVLAVTLGLGAAFAVFYLFHLLLYYYNFAWAEAVGLKDYDRYITPYYIGWLLAELCLLGRAASHACYPRLNRLAVLGAAAAMAVCVLWRGVPGSGFWDKADSIYSQRRDVHQKAAAFNEVLDWNDRVLVLSQGDNATRWYYYGYELNATVVYGFGGDYTGMYDEKGTSWPSTFMNLVETLNWELYDYQASCSPEGLEGYLRTQQCDYLLIDRTDRYLVGFTDRFEGGLTYAMPATLYRIEDAGEGAMSYRIAAVAS